MKDKLIHAFKKLKTIFPIKKLHTEVPLTAEQRHALTYVSRRAKQESDAALDKNGSLMLRAQKLKICEQDLMKTLDYIKNDVPLVIHVNISTLLLLVKDTMYRNQFETGRSGGAYSPFSRQVWENDMFDDAYDQVKPFDRCKYGCMNINSNNQPVLSANTYGDNYLIVGNNLRSRTTCWYGDSGDFKRFMGLGTLENYGHILAQYTDRELTRMVGLACKGRDPGACVENVESIYKEVQFHGPVNLMTDIQTLVINKRHLVNQQAVDIGNAFKSYGIEVIYSD